MASQDNSTSTPPDQNPPGPFDQRDSHRTLAIVVEGRRFWLSRELLAHYSPVFKTMLYGDFAEAKKKVIELPDKKAADFEEFLLCLIPTSMKFEAKEIDHSNVALILAYADEYQIDDMRRRSIGALIEMATEWPKNDQRLLNILQIASDYRLCDVLKLIVKKCALGFKIDQLQPIFKDLRPEVVAALSLYKNVIPPNRKCKFEYRTYERYCNIHKKFLPYFKCAYCKARGCTKCMKERKPALAKTVCGMVGISKVEEAVNELLDRLADE